LSDFAPFYLSMIRSLLETDSQSSMKLESFRIGTIATPFSRIWSPSSRHVRTSGIIRLFRVLRSNFLQRKICFSLILAIVARPTVFFQCLQSAANMLLFLIATRSISNLDFTIRKFNEVWKPNDSKTEPANASNCFQSSFELYSSASKFLESVGNSSPLKTHH